MENIKKNNPGLRNSKGDNWYNLVNQMWDVEVSFSKLSHIPMQYSQTAKYYPYWSVSTIVTLGLIIQKKFAIELLPWQSFNLLIFINLLSYFLFYIGRQSSITQISAVCEEQEFNRYATPTQEISEDACRVTGLKFNTATNELLYNDEPVSHKHPQQVLLDFIQFLMSLCASDKHIVLAAHNNRRFDSIILFNQLKFYKLWNHFSRYIVGFCDTLPFFKMLYPEFENYKQEYIAQKLLNEAYSAHNALDDCRMLMSLVKKTEKIDVLLSDYFYSSHQVTFQGVQPNKESLEHLLRNKVLSRTIFKKLEDSTLTYNHLKISYHRDGFDGLFYLLSEKTGSGKARISNNRRVIQKIADFFSNEEWCYYCIQWLYTWTCIDK